ncbi:MAG TPA: NapC/NirT family cytochrome c [Usitatibacter sp.]|nr:NapC/NirT family cytochrome c [Usitatibacter sp.]
MAQGPGFVKRTWQALRAPSAKWSVLALLVVGLLIGSIGVIGTQVMVAVTGTNEFCSSACHSMQWVAKEYQESGHHINAKGVQAGCHDCHIPHAYPALLFYKAKAGIKDAISEMAGTISTEEKFNKERKRLAEVVWAEFKANNSENCRSCHTITAEVVKKQKDFVQPMHQQFLQGAMTCVDCHKGIAHKAPD